MAAKVLRREKSAKLRPFQFRKPDGTWLLDMFGDPVRIMQWTAKAAQHKARADYPLSGRCCTAEPV